jgi:nitrogen PTS system EIIA component
MTVSTWLNASRIHANLHVATMRELFKKLSMLAAMDTGYDQKLLFEALKEREKISSTGVGMGVAMPHLRLVSVEKVSAYCITLASPIDYKALDKLPVQIVCFLLSPASLSVYAMQEHNHALAAFSRLMRQQEVRNALLAGDFTKLWAAPLTQQGQVA